MVFDKLQKVRASLALDDLSSYKGKLTFPLESDYEMAENISQAVELLHQKEVAAQEEFKRASSAYTEALSFSNMKVPYSELESLSFLTLRIGKI